MKQILSEQLELFVRLPLNVRRKSTIESPIVIRGVRSKFHGARSGALCIHRAELSGANFGFDAIDDVSTAAALREVLLHLLVPLVHLLLIEPAGESRFLFGRQTRDGFFQGFESHTYKLGL